MKPIIKVDRVKSVREALELQALGVDIIGVSIGEDVRFNDERQITLHTANDICKSLSLSKSCCQISLDKNCLSSIKGIKNWCFDFIQILEFELNDLSNINRREYWTEETRIIYSGITASYDDNPSWIFSSFEDDKYSNISYFHLDLLAHMREAWFFLKYECPKYTDTLQISDINELASQYPILIGIDPSIEAILDCLKLMPGISGINFTLASNPNSNNVHYVDYLELISILNGIRG